MDKSRLNRRTFGTILCIPQRAFMNSALRQQVMSTQAVHRVKTKCITVFIWSKAVLCLSNSTEKRIKAVLFCNITTFTVQLFINGNKKEW